MKKIALSVFVLLLALSVKAQFVAKMQIKGDVPGLCNKNEVYALLPGLKGQIRAVCPVTNDEILDRLNSEVRFLKENPDYNDKGMIGIIINCKGIVVQCKMDNKTRSEELDHQIESVFNSLGEWKPGKLKKKNVDSIRLFKFVIEGGKFSFP